MAFSFLVFVGVLSCTLIKICSCGKSRPVFWIASVVFVLWIKRPHHAHILVTLQQFILCVFLCNASVSCLPLTVLRHIDRLFEGVYIPIFISNWSTAEKTLELTLSFSKVIYTITCYTKSAIALEMPTPSFSPLALLACAWGQWCCCPHPFYPSSF